MKDLTREMHFAENCETTLGELERLANRLLETTWSIGIYVSREAKIVNLKAEGWKFEYNTRKRAAGLCNFTLKKIYLSKYLVAQNLEKGLNFENTLRHEVAHALDFAMGGRNHHNSVWKAIARKVLCTAERCYKSSEIGDTQSKYTLICDNCEKEQASHKRSKREAACGACCRKYNFGKFDSKYTLRRMQNY
jgi:predicted SprT family Zn-dependent metalloprotease